MSAQISDLLQNSFIWHPTAPAGTQLYCAFRKRFTLPATPRAAMLHIFADNRYVLWINGIYVERGPCRFDPKRPEYDSLDVLRHLKQGENLLALLVHHYAIRSFKEWRLQCARMMDHDPGVTALLQLEFPDREPFHILTDPSWRVSAKTRFLPSPGTYSSIPDNIDCRVEEGDWTQPDFDDSSWEYARRQDGGLWGKICPRSIPLLRETEIRPRRIVQRNGAIEDSDLAAQLPLSMGGEAQIVLDVGRAVLAYSVLDFVAEAGTELEVGYAVRFFETGCRAECHKSCRYIARSGRQRYMSLDTFGFKYLAISVRSGRILLEDVKVVDRRYPFTRVGRFESSDAALDELWRRSLNTIELCSEDAFVDCADRERAQWLGDAVVVEYPIMRACLAGPEDESGLRYHDTRLFRNMLRHVALGQLPDGRLQPMRPSEYAPELIHGVIDDYSCLWVHGLRELYDRTRDAAFVLELWPSLVKLMEYFLGRRTERGLVNAMEFIIFRNPLAYKVCEGASINAYIHRALVDAAHLGEVVGDTARAERYSAAARDLYSAYNRELWMESEGSYSGGVIGGEKSPPTGHAAALALYFEMVPEPRRERVFQFMLSHFENENPFTYAYKFFLDVLFRRSTEDYDRLALEIIRRKWSHMNQHETGTVRENFHSGSFLHNFGAVPAYFLSSYVLGVRTVPLEGAPQIIIEPRLANLRWAKGVVATEYGPVAVSWEREKTDSLRFAIEIPKSAQAQAGLPIVAENTGVLLDGEKLTASVANGRFLRLVLSSGRHEGVIFANR